MTNFAYLESCVFFDFKMWKRIFGSEFVFDLPALEVPLCSLFVVFQPVSRRNNKFAVARDDKSASITKFRAFYRQLKICVYHHFLFDEFELSAAYFIFFRSEPNGLPWVWPNSFLRAKFSVMSSFFSTSHFLIAQRRIFFIIFAKVKNGMQLFLYFVKLILVRVNLTYTF